eukprot:scaffold10917_cov155-Amphora_coffeaeformis.AAC.2
MSCSTLGYHVPNAVGRRKWPNNQRNFSKQQQIAIFCSIHAGQTLRQSLGQFGNHVGRGGKFVECHGTSDQTIFRGRAGITPKPRTRLDDVLRNTSWADAHVGHLGVSTNVAVALDQFDDFQRLTGIKVPTFIGLDAM